MLKYHSLKYLTVYSLPFVVFCSIYLAGWWSYSALVFVFVAIPFFELFTNGSTTNMDKLEEELAKDDRFFDYLLYALVPIHYLLLCFFLYRIGASELLLFEKIGITTAYGIACGFAINNAHELGHRAKNYEKLMSKMLLLTSLYMHFFIEHNRGHHKRVATADDPASSRYGENIYAFYIRTVYGSWVSAWQLEKKRLNKENQAFWSLGNEMLRFQFIQLTLILFIGIVFGTSVLLYFIMGASMGFLLLETVNYIEHYGLSRKKKGNSYERALPIHSWNSNHPIGRLILLELSRHSDHHYSASRKYQILRHFDQSPQMPTGYPGMMLLSLVPPLWFKIMHLEIDRYRHSIYGNDLA